MAKGNIDIKIDPFLTNTRMVECKNHICKFYCGGNCHFKKIRITVNGECKQAEIEMRGDE
ncbi:MAG: hypothetical protein GY853_15980 [PVC group bacterium]|nr:hypothetical protein [PVC group bacterium]